jgi:hypothetical protein
MTMFLIAILLSRNCEPPSPSKDPHNSTPTSSDREPNETSPLIPSQPSSSIISNGTPNGTTTPCNKSPPRSLKDYVLSLLPPLSPSTRSLLLRLSLLFAIDSIASGLTPASWLTYFFVRKFSLPEGTLGTIFFTTSLISSFSNLLASSISRRIGLVKTMVFTHIPAAIALALIPIPGKLWMALTLLIVRASMNSMDQAPRQAFLAAAVLPGERTAVMGAVNVVKTCSQSVGPVITGWLAQTGKFWIAFVVAGGLKLLYDVGMLAWFVGHKTREEGTEESGHEDECEDRDGGEGDGGDEGEREAGDVEDIVAELTDESLDGNGARHAELRA